MTILIPEVEEALSRREEYELNKLNKDLWDRSFKKTLIITDANKGTYMITLSNENREPKSLKFYCQSLDEHSQKIFEQFKKNNWFQKLGDGYSKSSPFAIQYAGNYFKFKN